MNTEVKESLCEEVLTELDIMKGEEVGSDKHKAALDTVTKLTDRLIEIEKIELDSRDKNKTRESEMFYKNAQMAEDKRNRWINVVVKVVEIGVPVLTYVWATNRSLRFEETGTFTTQAGRHSIGNLFRFRR